MKRLLLAITLACVLSGRTMAGDMPTVSPAPTQSSAVVTVLLTILSFVVE